MVRIVTDSAANLPPSLVEQYNVSVVPLKVQIGNTSYLEGIDLTQQEFMERLPTANPLPTTSQPSPVQFEEVYSDILAQGDEIVSIHLSGKLSGTLNSARTAVQDLENAPISIVDSESVSAGTALLVLTAARMAETGKSREEIARRVEALTKDILLVFSLDTLEYLKRGGRIGGAQAFIGGLLGIKPVILIKDGLIAAGERARTRRKALETLAGMEADRFGTKPVWVGMAEVMANDVDQLETMIRQRLTVQELIRCQIGPVVAAHTGANTVGVAVMPDPFQ